MIGVCVGVLEAVTVNEGVAVAVSVSVGVAVMVTVGGVDSRVKVVVGEVGGVGLPVAVLVGVRVTGVLVLVGGRLVIGGRLSVTDAYVRPTTIPS